MSVWSYPRLFASDIITEVSHVFGVPEAILKGPLRAQRYVRPRHACYYLAQHLTQLSYPMIGRALGGRDHSTIIHGVRQAENRLERDPEYQAYVDAVRIRLLDSRARAERRRLEALVVQRERIRLEKEERERQKLELERQAREAAAVAGEAEAIAQAELDDMDELSRAVVAYRASGGTFYEVRA